MNKFATAALLMFGYANAKIAACRVHSEEVLDDVEGYFKIHSSKGRSANAAQAAFISSRWRNLESGEDYTVEIYDSVDANMNLGTKLFDVASFSVADDKECGGINRMRTDDISIADVDGKIVALMDDFGMVTCCKVEQPARNGRRLKRKSEKKEKAEKSESEESEESVSSESEESEAEDGDEPVDGGRRFLL